MKKGKFILRKTSGLFLQQFVDVVDVVEAVVDEEAQLGDDAQLVVHASSQFVPDALFVGCDILQQLLTVV